MASGPSGRVSFNSRLREEATGRPEEAWVGACVSTHASVRRRQNVAHSICRLLTFQLTPP